MLPQRFQPTGRFSPMSDGEDFSPPGRLDEARRHARDVGQWAGEVIVRLAVLFFMMMAIYTLASQK